MDATHARFATTDPAFYDDPRRRPRAGGSAFAPDPDLDWSGWSHSDDGHWSRWSPPSSSLPAQGWKVHASIVPALAPDLLRGVSRYCRHHGLAFKHLSHPDVLMAVDGKEGERSASGKFVTIYPADESELHDTLVDLDGLVGGMPGPYVLSDLRWNAGPLSVRYGAFVHEEADIGGVRVAVIRSPTGELVEDVRTPSFRPPPWITLPPFLDAQLASLGGMQPPPGFPSITRALHHSNAGGVYEATDLDGTAVVLKEARPHAGVTPDGRDAVTRLRHEARVLARIPAPTVAAPRRSFSAHGHEFLVLDRVDGVPLNRAVVTRHPLVRAGSSRRERLTYRRWAVRVAERLAATVADVHAAGFSHGDLHPGNVLVTPDDEVVLLDFEMAQPLGREVPAIIGAPGFVPRDGRGGEKLDRYALACIRLFVFAPLTPLLGLDPDKATDLVAWVRDRFELDAAWARGILNDLDLPLAAGEVTARASVRTPPAPADPATALEPLISGVIAALEHDLDASRGDRAWPGDPRQFSEPAFALAHGAAGVLAAMHGAGARAPDTAWEWFDRAVRRGLGDPSPRLGLFDGLAGLAWTQRRLGLHGDADRTIHRIRDADLERLGPDLYGGLAGLGLVLLSESETDPALLPRVHEIAARIRDRFARRPLPPARTAVTDRGGLLRGASGIALFAIRYFARTGDAAFRQLAEDAIDTDLAACIRLADGSLQVDEGWRTMPYLGAGSAGIGMVLLEILPHSTRRRRHEDTIAGLRTAAAAEFVVHSGLFQGRAGLIHFLLALERHGHATSSTDAARARHVQALALHAVHRPRGVGFPGDGLMRLSCDLATGSAGVLTALAAHRAVLRGTRTAHLGVPFLDSPPDNRAARVADDPARVR